VCYFLNVFSLENISQEIEYKNLSMITQKKNPY
jgi:hypothetical protein